MGRFILSRAAQGLVVIAGVSVVVFAITHLIANPVRALLPLGATEQQRIDMTHSLGLDRPIPIQFADYIAHVARFDFGDSLWQRRPAMEIVAERLPYTLELVFIAIALAVVLGMTIGVVAALRPGSIVDKVAVFLSLAGLSMPQFWLGLLLIIVFSVQLHVLPTSGTGDVSNFVLPVVTLALPAVARIAMIVRSSMIDELNQQYVMFATAKGIPYYRVVGLHALKNAAVPAVTLTGWELIRALAGYTVVVEVVFGWPGLGHLAIDAISRQDIVLLEAIVMVVAAMVVVISIAIDIIHKAIDPRIKLS